VGSDLGSGQRLLARIPGAELAGRLEVRVSLPATGSIQLLVPEEATIDVVCIDAAGSLFSGIRRAGRLVFTELPEGEYHVGPRHRVERIPFLRARGEAPAPIALGAGELRELPWVPAWSSPEEVEGRVQTVGIDPRRLVVAAVFGPSEAPIRASRLLPTALVRADGSFRFPDLSAVPPRFAVFGEIGASAEGLMAVSPAGSPLRVDCASVELEVTGPADGAPVKVRVNTRPMFPVDVMALAGGVVYRGRTGEPFRIGPIPCHVREITVASGGRTRRVPVSLASGRTNVLTVPLE
jgi:hypothetical protein